MFRTCSITGLIECWFTKPFLDEFENWDLSKKQILEFGAGQDNPTILITKEIPGTLHIGK
jgi:hypothetical protein